VRLPGFLVSEEVGMGDVIKKATAWAGVKPCGGCNKRAAALNQRVTFTPRGRQ
jgi:adenosyl cobinamide kinase/adenosyl cobinamide phosphate guanylyltransferase